MSYYIKVTMESGNGDEVYQLTTFQQNYDDHKQQVDEQVPAFRAVAEAVLGEMQKAGEYYKKKHG